MSQWWTYRPEDFLLFSEQVYWRLFALTNAAVWPWPVAALALGAAILALAMMRRAVADRLIAAILAAGWLVVAWVFFWSRYRTVNWAASYVAPLFVLEAALLFVIGSMRNNLSFRVTKDPGVILGLLLFVYALAIHPLTALAAGRPSGRPSCLPSPPRSDGDRNTGAAGGGKRRCGAMVAPAGSVSLVPAQLGDAGNAGNLGGPACAGIGGLRAVRAAAEPQFCTKNHSRVRTPGRISRILRCACGLRRATELRRFRSCNILRPVALMRGVLGASRLCISAKMTLRRAARSRAGLARPRHLALP
ncbi:DUF6064 family protein [Roseibium salinum]|nr:DUF6064 family protein [Roseibium salinum]